MDSQNQAIQYTDGHARLIAGPGTGKTYSIIEHIKHLLDSGVTYNQVQALTFSAAAGREMRERLVKALPGQKVPDARTLHSFCFKELRTYTGREYVGNEVLDSWEEDNLLAADLAVQVGATPARIKQMLGEHDAAWRSLTTPPSGAQQSALENEVEALRETFDLARRGELVYKFKKFLDSNPHYRPQLSDLIVDEYQDLNACDLAVIRELVRRSGCRLYVAGDDDQCIYRFRHADPSGIRDFETEYLNSRSFQLQICRRCGQPILDAATRLMSREQNRIPKQMTSSKAEGSVKVYSFTGVRAQTRWVVEAVQEHIAASKDLHYKDILILVPKRNFATTYVDALKAQGIPAENYANVEAVLSSDEVRRLIYAVKFAHNPENAVAVRAWLHLTPRIGPATIRSIIDAANKNHLSFYGACKSHGSDAVNRSLGELEALAATLSDSTTFEETLSATEISDEAREEVRNLAKSLLAESEAVETVEAISEAPEEPTEEVQITDEGPDVVRVMTFRGAKGLSAQLVIVTDLDDDILPGNADDLDEARRLLYVSITRAIHSLYLTHVVDRRGQTRYAGAGHRAPGSARQRSRFLDEIGIPSESSR